MREDSQSTAEDSVTQRPTRSGGRRRTRSSPRHRSAARLPASLPSSSLHPPFSPKSSVDEQPWSLVLFSRTGLGHLPPFRTLAMLGL